MKTNNYLHSDLSGKVLQAFYKVYNTLGFGFLEKVYENAMKVELNKMGINCQQQYPIDVFYEGKKVGSYFADLLIDNKLIVELKSVEKLASEHEAQLVNYLRATELEVGLLLNFGKNPTQKRRVLTNDFKPPRTNHY